MGKEERQLELFTLNNRMVVYPFACFGHVKALIVLEKLVSLRLDVLRAL